MNCMKKACMKLAFDKVKEIWNTEPRSSQNDKVQNQIESNEFVLHIDD